jgi:hypothetical protein
LVVLIEKCVGECLCAGKFFHQHNNDFLHRGNCPRGYDRLFPDIELVPLLFGKKLLFFVWHPEGCAGECLCAGKFFHKYNKDFRRGGKHPRGYDCLYRYHQTQITNAVVKAALSVEYPQGYVGECLRAGKSLKRFNLDFRRRDTGRRGLIAGHCGAWKSFQEYVQVFAGTGMCFGKDDDGISLGGCFYHIFTYNVSCRGTHPRGCASRYPCTKINSFIDLMLFPGRANRQHNPGQSTPCTAKPSVKHLYLIIPNGEANPRGYALTRCTEDSARRSSGLLRRRWNRPQGGIHVSSGAGDFFYYSFRCFPGRSLGPRGSALFSPCHGKHFYGIQQNFPVRGENCHCLITNSPCAGKFIANTEQNFPVRDKSTHCITKILPCAGKFFIIMKMDFPVRGRLITIMKKDFPARDKNKNCLAKNSPCAGKFTASMKKDFPVRGKSFTDIEMGFPVRDTIYYTIHSDSPCAGKFFTDIEQNFPVRSKIIITCIGIPPVPGSFLRTLNRTFRSGVKFVIITIGSSPAPESFSRTPNRTFRTAGSLLQASNRTFRTAVNNLFFLLKIFTAPGSFSRI